MNLINLRTLVVVGLVAMPIIGYAILSVDFDRMWPTSVELRIVEVQRTKTATAAPSRSILRATWSTSTRRGIGVYTKGSPFASVMWAEDFFSVETNSDSATCRPRCQSPLLIDFDSNGFQLTELGQGTEFDFTGNGQKTNTHWVAKGTSDAFLALDLDGNNSIDNGAELFGDSTKIVGDQTRTAIDGFDALSQYDEAENGGNADGKINRKDKIWPQLLIWGDKNGNGISEENEISKVTDSKIRSFKLRVNYDADNIDINGSLLQDWTWVRTKKPANPPRLKMVDVWFTPIDPTQ